MHQILCSSIVASILLSHVYASLFAPPSLLSRHDRLVNCLSARNVPTSYSSSPDWPNLVTPYNLRLSYTPVAITVPKTSQQVSDSVICATISRTRVQAKSGGHSYASYSSGGQDGSLVIDLKEIHAVSVNLTTGIASVGGGTRLGNLALAIYQQGQRGLPHGTCPGVGIGGHFTHGGYGYGSRAWGLALDTIVGMDVVLANGTFIHTTATIQPQLFWALRGAADSLGIVTTFYLQTLPAPATVINFSIDLPEVLSSATMAAKAFLELQSFALNSPLINRDLTFGIYTNASCFILRGWYFGHKEHFTNFLLPTMLNGFPAAQTTIIKELSWLDSLTYQAEEPLAQPLSGKPTPDTFYAQSITTREAQPLTLGALHSFFSFIIDQGKNFTYPWFSIINLYGGLDSQINSKPVAGSAYSNRDSLWVIQNYGRTSDFQLPYDPAITTFVNSLTTSLTSAQADGNFAAYLNYVDPNLTAGQAAEMYYGPMLYAQLLEVKKSIDPDFTFWNPQAIGNAAYRDYGNRSSLAGCCSSRVNWYQGGGQRAFGVCDVS